MRLARPLRALLLAAVLGPGLLAIPGSLAPVASAVGPLPDCRLDDIYTEPRGYDDWATTQVDWMLPRMDGPEVLRRLRDGEGKGTPVIMLTARDELPDKIAGFRAGADDYLTKPFALPELEVRLEALMARASGRDRDRVLEVHDLRLDLATLEASRAGKRLHLYPACRKLLEVLMRASPAAVTRERLEYALWGDEPPDGDMLRSHIYELRRSVDGPFQEKLIQTLPRVGYRVATMPADWDG